MIGPFLVAVVEAVELRDDDPGGERQDEEEQLGAAGDVVPVGRRLEEQQRRRERDRQPEEVGDQERPPDEPTTALHDGRLPPPVEDRERALVDQIDYLVVKLKPLLQRRLLGGYDFGLLSPDPRAATVNWLLAASSPPATARRQSARSR